MNGNSSMRNNGGASLKVKLNQLEVSLRAQRHNCENKLSLLF